MTKLVTEAPHPEKIVFAHLVQHVPNAVYVAPCTLCKRVLSSPYPSVIVVEAAGVARLAAGIARTFVAPVADVGQLCHDGQQEALVAFMPTLLVGVPS